MDEKKEVFKYGDINNNRVLVCGLIQKELQKILIEIEKKKWRAKIVLDPIELFRELEDFKPKFLLLSVNFPSEQILVIPKLVYQTYPLKIISFSEYNDRKSKEILEKMTTEEKINMPYLPSDFATTLEKIKKEERKSLGLADEDFNNEISDFLNDETGEKSKRKEEQITKDSITGKSQQEEALNDNGFEGDDSENGPRGRDYEKQYLKLKEMIENSFQSTIQPEKFVKTSDDVFPIYYAKLSAFGIKGYLYIYCNDGYLANPNYLNNFRENLKFEIENEVENFSLQTFELIKINPFELPIVNLKTNEVHLEKTKNNISITCGFFKATLRTRFDLKKDSNNNYPVDFKQIFYSIYLSVNIKIFLPMNKKFLYLAKEKSFLSKNNYEKHKNLGTPIFFLEGDHKNLELYLSASHFLKLIVNSEKS